MNRLDLLVLRSLFPIFLTSIAFFALLLEIIDLFSNITLYQNENASFSEIMWVQWLYLPKSISYAIPIACLFSTSFLIANFYANNELIIVYSIGRPLYRFIVPVIIFGIFWSAFAFFFEEYVVIPSFAEKNRFAEEITFRSRIYNANNVAVRSKQGRRVYYADYYDDFERKLYDIVIVDLGSDYKFSRRFDVEEALWNPETQSWDMEGVIIYTFVSEETIDIERKLEFRDHDFSIVPEAFQRKTKNIDELTIEEAQVWLAILEESGAEFARQKAEHYSRFSFALAPLIVCLISCSLAGRFRKNAILMSLLIALFISVAYYVMGSVSVVLVADGILSPEIAAWFSAVLFIGIGFILFLYATT